MVACRSGSIPDVPSEWRAFSLIMRPPRTYAAFGLVQSDTHMHPIVEMSPAPVRISVADGESRVSLNSCCEHRLWGNYNRLSEVMILNVVR